MAGCPVSHGGRDGAPGLVAAGALREDAMPRSAGRPPGERPGRMGTYTKRFVTEATRLAACASHLA